MSGHRQTALLLHELGEEDRRWLVGQIPDEDRSILKELLDELQSLRIPSDGNLLERVMAPRAEAPPSEPAGPAAPGDAVRRASAQQMSDLLAREPAWLLAIVLGIEAWPWREAFLSKLEPVRRDAVQAAMRGAPAPRLKEALIGEIEKRLAQWHARSGAVCSSPSTGRYRLLTLLNSIKGNLHQWLR
ncbi:MAG TPA: hypothetical protein VEC06_08775 [Paucimonas sp.]|nr:hypothetical protein [Paucimonas sp.]